MGETMKQISPERQQEIEAMFLQHHPSNMLISDEFIRTLRYYRRVLPGRKLTLDHFNLPVPVLEIKPKKSIINILFTLFD